MKNIEEIKDEYVKNITIHDKFDSWHHYRAYNYIGDSDLDTICEQYAKQYIDRVKELEDCLKCMLSLSMAQGSSKEWFEIIEANRLLKK